MKNLITIFLVLVGSVIMTSCCVNYEGAVKNMTPPVKIVKIIAPQDSDHIVDGTHFKPGNGQVTVRDADGEEYDIHVHEVYGTYGMALYNTYKVGDVVIDRGPDEKVVETKKSKKKLDVLERY